MSDSVDQAIAAAPEGQSVIRYIFRTMVFLEKENSKMNLEEQHS